MIRTTGKRNRSDGQAEALVTRRSRGPAVRTEATEGTAPRHYILFSIVTMGKNIRGGSRGVAVRGVLGARYLTCTMVPDSGIPPPRAPSIRIPNSKFQNPKSENPNPKPPDERKKNPIEGTVITSQIWPALSQHGQQCGLLGPSRPQRTTASTASRRAPTV